ncbi:MAG: BACON domain-containing carbohydrate-binding protein [Pseudomonadota bacterium]
MSVTAATGCAWTASSSLGWAGVSPGSGSGNGTVSVTVASNTTGSPRTGTITIAGSSFTISQSAASCSYSISPTSTAITSPGGIRSVSVTAATGCAWTASSSLGWASVSPSSGSGNGTVTVTVAPNPTSSTRSGSVNITNQTYSISQSANSNGVLALSNGVPVGGIQLSQGEMIDYYIDVPANVNSLHIQIWGGLTGEDADVYVKYGNIPTRSVYDYGSWFVGNDEDILIQHPQKGGWYISLHGYAAASNVTLKVQYSTFNWNLFMPAILHSNVLGQ